jgi:hypothetical protein
MTTKKHPERKEGAALITVLVMVVMASIMVTGVYYLINKGVGVSGLEKRYQTAREASFGGMDVYLKEIIPLAISGKTLSSVVSGFATITSATVAKGSLTDTCFSNKLLKDTANWGSGCDYTPNAKTSPDVTFTLSGVGTAAPFSVYAKIVDTVPGNSDTSGVLLEGGGGVAESQSGVIMVQHFPYLYRMEVQGERQTRPDEKAGFAVLYAY